MAVREHLGISATMSPASIIVRMLITGPAYAGEDIQVALTMRCFSSVTMRITKRKRSTGSLDSVEGGDTVEEGQDPDQKPTGPRSSVGGRGVGSRGERNQKLSEVSLKGREGDVNRNSRLRRWLQEGLRQQEGLRLASMGT